MIENFKTRSMTKSPTKPIDTNTNTRLYLKMKVAQLAEPVG